MTFEEQIKEVRSQMVKVIAENAAKGWQGISPEEFTVCTELRGQWGDFREKQSIRGQMAVAWKRQLGKSFRTVFNGEERRRAFPAFRNGESLVLISMDFQPDFGHANYGYQKFISLAEFYAKVEAGEFSCD